MVVTRQQIKKLFIEYNGLYFNAELPLCEIRVSSHHRYYGLFQYRRNSQNKAVCKSITISDLFDYTEENLRSVLVHEMIHYYLMWNGEDVNGTHGEAFLGMAEMFNKKFKLNITPTIDMTDYVLSPGKTLFMYKLRMMMPF